MDGGTTPPGTGDTLAKEQQAQRRGCRDCGKPEWYYGSCRNYGNGNGYERQCIGRSDDN